MTPATEPWLEELMRLHDVAAQARANFILTGDGANVEEDAVAALEAHARDKLKRDLAETPEVKEQK